MQCIALVRSRRMGDRSDRFYGSKDSVVASELRSIKPGAKVYERRSNLFFLSSRDAALASAEERLSADAEGKAQAANKAQTNKEELSDD